MRVVLDTNVLIAAFISPHGAPARVVKLWLDGDFDLITSSWQLGEFRRTSRYDRIKNRVNAAEIGTFINAVRQNARVIERLPSIEVSPDPDDNYIVATAITGKAHYLVTGDKLDLQLLVRVQGVRIVSVGEFAAFLG